ncbi:MAG: VCBS repeat-containing protein, partial [Candidatus Altiarchaeota archaeon]
VHILNIYGEEISTISPGVGISSTPAVFDYNADGQSEIIIATKDNRVYLYDKDGDQIWMYQSKDPIAFSPVLVYELIEEDDPLIIVGDVVLDFSGTRRTKNLKQSITREFLMDKGIGYIDSSDGYIVADLNNDGRFQTNVKPEKGGEVLGNLFGGENYAIPTVGDVTGDGQKEVVYWGQKPLGEIGAGIDFGGQIRNDDFIYLLSNKLEEIWKYTIPRINGASLADLYGDDRLEIVIGSEKGVIYILNPSGSADWHLKLEGGISHPPAIADLDGDGNPEILVSTNANTLYVIGGNKFVKPTTTSSLIFTTSTSTSSTSTSSTSTTSTFVFTSTVYTATETSVTQEENIQDVVENLLIPGLIIIIFFLLVLFFKWPKSKKKPPSKLEKAGFRKKDLEESVPPSNPYHFKP